MLEGIDYPYGDDVIGYQSYFNMMCSYCGHIHDAVEVEIRTHHLGSWECEKCDSTNEIDIDEEERMPATWDEDFYFPEP